MSQPTKILISLFFLTFFISSCKDEITNQYLEEGGSAPDVNVIFSNYSLETVHSYHMDTAAYPTYNYCINLSLELDKPGNRNQINKIIIVNEYGIGWEFFSDELEGFYSDTLGGYELKNLVFRTTGSSQYSTLFKVRLFSKSNKTSEDYQFILIPDFLSPNSPYHNWYTHNIYQVRFYYPQSSVFSLGEVTWLNQQKQVISKANLDASQLFNDEYFRLDNVPDDAYFFYIYFESERNKIKISFKSEILQIAERFPDNIQILAESINNMDIVKFVPEIQKTIIVDRNYRSLYIVDFNTLNLNNKIIFDSPPINIAYSNYDGKIYVVCENGKLYSVNTTDISPSFVKNLSTNGVYGTITIGKYLIASTYDNVFKILNLENNTVEIHDGYYYISNMVFNKTNNVVYGLSGSELMRFNFNPVTGYLSDFKSVYCSSSNDSYLLLYPDDSKIITSSGFIFNCTSDVLNDLSHYGNLERGFTTAAFSNDNNNIIALRSGYYSSEPSDIMIYSKSNFEVIGYTEDFWGIPKSLIVDGNLIKVISLYNNSIMAELFNYSDIISGGKMLNKPIKDKYYLSKKIKL